MTAMYVEYRNIDNIHFEDVYSTELQLNKANAYATEAAFLDLNLIDS